MSSPKKPKNARPAARLKPKAAAPAPKKVAAPAPKKKAATPAAKSSKKAVPVKGKTAVAAKKPAVSAAAKKQKPASAAKAHKAPVKPAVKAPVKSAVKTPVKPAVKTPAKPAVKTPAKPAVKPVVKATVRPTVQPVVKAAAPVTVAKTKPVAVPAPKVAAPTAAVQKAASPSKQPLPKQPKGKSLSREFMFDLAGAIREAVLPVAKTMRGQEVVSTAVSGDATFELDRLAEKALLTFLRNARAPVAYYSEDSGYSTFSNVQPKHLLIVDPIDGTRAAKSAFEGCVVAIGSTQVIERPRIVDLETACVMEIMGERTFYAERGSGARIYEANSVKRPRLSQNTNLEKLTWSMTVPARPAELIFPTAARLIDLSSLKGGFFACNSSSFSLTRLLTGQQDALIDVASRYMRDIPTYVRDYFINAGRGVVLGVAPYDFAAALLIAQEAGCSVTNAYGESFDEVMLLDSSEGNHQSIIAAANKELHQKLFSFFDTRIRQFEGLLQRRS